MVSKITTWVDRKALTKQIELDIWDSGFIQGQRDAKAGIIKRLEELIPAKPTYEMPMEYWVQRKLVEKAIALIKGETE